MRCTFNTSSEVRIRSSSGRANEGRPGRQHGTRKNHPVREISLSTDVLKGGHNPPNKQDVALRSCFTQPQQSRSTAFKAGPPTARTFGRKDALSVGLTLVETSRNVSVWARGRAAAAGGMGCPWGRPGEQCRVAASCSDRALGSPSQLQQRSPDVTARRTFSTGATTARGLCEPSATAVRL